MWLRLDVDHAVALKYKPLGRRLNLLKIKYGLPVPFLLNHVEHLKKLLSNYRIPRIWFFRRFTCPKEWDEPFGVHIQSPETAEQDVAAVVRNLGPVEFFTRHGFSEIASGRLWFQKEIEVVERKWNLRDLSALPHIMVSRCDPETVSLSELDHVLFHPCYVHTHKEKLVKMLERIKNENCRLALPNRKN